MTTKILSAFLVLLAVAVNVHGGSIVSPSTESTEKLLNLDFGRAYKLLIDAYKKMMPCGFSAWNIPPLAPLRIDNYQFNSNDENLQINAGLRSLVINGLNKFQFIRYWSRDSDNSMSYDVILPEYQVLGEYNIAVNSSIAGFPLNFESAGLLNIKIKDLRVVGNVALEENSARSGARIADFKINFYVGDAEIDNWNDLVDVSINNFVNRWHREFFLMWVRHVDFNELYSQYFVPRLNDLLEDVTVQKLVSTFSEWTDELSAVQCSAP